VTSQNLKHRQLPRRDLLKGTTAFGALVLGAGYVAGQNGAWASEMNALQPDSFATLVQMARDIYPHDQVADEFYVAAVKGYDSTDAAPGIEDGIKALNAAANSMKGSDYAAIGWERDRVDVLRSMEDDAFFQQIRGGLVTGLYNQKAVWPIFGYEGESFSQGGYINRGFDDIAWIG